MTLTRHLCCSPVIFLCQDPRRLLGFDRTIQPDKCSFHKIVQMISFNPESGGIVAPFPSFLLAQRANLRRRLVPALTHCHTKTEVILFSSTRVSQAWGKSHHPWRTTEGDRGRVSSSPSPNTLQGLEIILLLPIYPFSCSSICTVSDAPDRCRNVQIRPHFPNQREPAGQISVDLSDPRAKQPFPHGTPLAGPMTVRPASVFNFTPFCVHKALLITNRPQCAS